MYNVMLHNDTQECVQTEAHVCLCFTCMRGVRGQVKADTRSRVFALEEGRLRGPNTIEPWSL